MKRLMLLATAVVFAACSPKADEAAPGDAMTPAATDTARVDTTMMDTTKTDTTVSDTTKRP